MPSDHIRSEMTELARAFSEITSCIPYETRLELSTPAGGSHVAGVQTEGDWPRELLQLCERAGCLCGSMTGEDVLVPLGRWGQACLALHIHGLLLTVDIIRDGDRAVIQNVAAVSHAALLALLDNDGQPDTFSAQDALTIETILRGLLLPAPKVADLLNVDIRTLRSWASKGRVPKCPGVAWPKPIKLSGNVTAYDAWAIWPALLAYRGDIRERDPDHDRQLAQELAAIKHSGG